jgi:hypothetical protein
MKVSTEKDNNFGYEKITTLVDNIPLNGSKYFALFRNNKQHVEENVSTRGRKHTLTRFRDKEE